MSWENFLSKVNKDDNICVFTIGRMHPFHKGHKELVCDVMRKTKQITDMGFNATAYVYLSATNEENRWITSDEKIKKYLTSKKRISDREKRITEREINKIKSQIKKSEPLPTSYRLTFLHKMLEKKSCGENFTNPIVLYDQSVTSLGRDLRQFSIGRKITKGSKKSGTLAVSNSIMVRDRHGNLPSLKCINFLKNTRKHNKVILLVGSDRVEAFKRYNEEKMNELFGVGNAFILQSGGERGDSGEGDKALDELEVLFANMSLDDDNSGESKVPVREDYSGSLSRKKALGQKDDIKQFLHMIDYRPNDDIGDIEKLIVKIRDVNGISNRNVKKYIREAVREFDDDDDFDRFAERFVKSGEERKKLREQRGFGRTKKIKKRKRCSKKRLKKNMICHKGTKKKLRKLRKLTKKLKIKLTRCSKKRLKKWKVKKSRKKM
tara:strand:+ start:4484 stop:5788 length:1305 start_codon:yes stop_codon:yes gene_type:complete